MKKKNNIQNIGRPREWTDKELMQLALDTKYKHHGIKLTPSLLEKETKVGRNTWSRRMKDHIDKLNKPILTKHTSTDADDALLPNIDLIFKKYGNDKVALKNELLELEVLLYDTYKELKEYKLKEEVYNKAIDNMLSIKNEVDKQKKRANHYEELYNEIVVSSIYPHLKDTQGSLVNKLNINDKLINMEEYQNKNISLNDLSSSFPDVSDKSNQKKNADSLESKQQKNMKKLLDEFDT